jgi:hypothetical protein
MLAGLAPTLRRYRVGYLLTRRIVLGIVWGMEGSTMATTATAETIQVGDVILPPARELSLWMRRTAREKGLGDEALYLTVTEIREGTPDKGGRWIVIKSQQTAEWKRDYRPESTDLPFVFKARPATPWSIISRATVAA